MSDLYYRIKEKRLQLGMSQEELAKKLGYKTKSSINKIELGKADIPQSKIASFAKALETTPGCLMGWDSDADVQRIAKKIESCEKMKHLFDLAEDSSPEELQKYINVIAAIKGDPANKSETR